MRISISVAPVFVTEITNIYIISFHSKHAGVYKEGKSRLIIWRIEQRTKAEGDSSRQKMFLNVAFKTFDDCTYQRRNKLKGGGK